MTTYYTTPEDVATFMGLGSGYFSASSTPTRSEVESIINQVEDYMDEWTHMAWREKSASHGQYEYHTLGRIGVRGSWFVWLGYPAFLKYRFVRQFDASKGDVIEVFNGNEWEDWLATKTEGIGEDYWVDYDNGIIYFRGLWVYLGLKEYVLRVKYRYGMSYVPEDIKMAATYLTAAHLVEITDRSFILPEGGSQVVSAPEKAQRWRESALNILDRWREWVVGGG